MSTGETDDCNSDKLKVATWAIRKREQRTPPPTDHTSTPARAGPEKSALLLHRGPPWHLGSVGHFQERLVEDIKQPSGLLGSQTWAQGQIFPGCSYELFQRPKSSQEGLTVRFVD